jgi:ABC transport system ATP-binding/permease protein
MTELRPSPARSLPSTIPLPANKSSLVIARDPGDDVDVALDDREISRQAHAQIRVDENERVWLKDLSGTQMCTVDGAAVGLEDVEVLDGVWVRFGRIPYERVGQTLELRLDSDGIAIEVVKATVDVVTTKGLRRLLDRVSFEIQAHDFVGIIGPSGAGKSTLLRVLAAQQELSTGHITVSDHRGPLHENWTANSLGFVPQDDALHGRLNVEQSLSYAAELRLKPGQSRDRILDQVIKQLKLQDVRGLCIDDGLSGGQRKRVNVGHELLSRPRLLCLDEPSSGLDPHLERELMLHCQKLARQGCTVVCTTHIMESLDLFDRLIVLAEGGRLAFCGSPRELLEHFNIESAAALYPKLLGQASWGFQAEGEESKEKPTSLRQAEESRSFLRQVSVLTRRFARLTLFDLKVAWTCFLLPLLVGLGIRLALPSMVYKESILFFGVVAILWFGLQGSALELVRERAIFIRERRTGLGLLPYLLSKCLVLAFIGLGQTLTLSSTFFISFLDEQQLGLPTGFLSGFLDLQDLRIDIYAIAVLWWTYVLGLVLGLAVSSFVSSERQANLLVPMLIIPMLLFSGKGMAISDTLLLMSDALSSSGQLDTPREWLSVLNPVRHSYELIYFTVRYSEIPSLSRGFFEYLILTLIPVLSFVLAAWWQFKLGRREVVQLSDHTIPSLNNPIISDEERARALQAAVLYRGSQRCPRCAYKRIENNRCRQCGVDPRAPKAAEHIRRGSGMAEIFRGGWYIPRGFWTMISHKRLLKFAIVPLLINIAFVIGAFYFASWIKDSLDSTSPQMLTQWSGPFWGRLRFGVIVLIQWSGRLSVVFVPLMAAYIFALFGKFPLMPFMEILAEKTCEEIVGPAPDVPFQVAVFLRNLAIGLWDALLVTVLQLFLLLVFFPLAYIPLIGPILWFSLPPAFGASIDYVDLNLVVRHYKIMEKLRLLWRRKGRFFGFGLAFFLCLEIPWVNLLLGMVLLPTATVGGALLFMELDDR